MAELAGKTTQARTVLLEAAKAVLRRNGFAGLSTRDVAAEAGMPLSQIHCHFRSEEGLLLALFEYLNAQLLHRQHAMFGNDELKLSEQWGLACEYLDDDLATGYVRVLQELWTAGYSNPEIAKVVREGLVGWQDLLTEVARKAEARFGRFQSFAPEEIAALVATAFVGGEAFILLGLESRRVPVRQALRRTGDLIRTIEDSGGKGRRNSQK